MNDWQVLLITGPAGAGKTTVARYIADTLPVPCVHVSLDNVRELVRSGMAFPTNGWSDEAGRQYELARKASAETARIYAEAGFRVVIDDAIFPQWEPALFVQWQKDLGALRSELVVLLPSLESVQTRNAERSGVRLLNERLVRWIHRQMRPWQFEPVRVIDNTELSVEATAALILND